MTDAKGRRHLWGRASHHLGRALARRSPRAVDRGVADARSSIAAIARSLRSKLFIPILVAAIGLGASIMSCVGQSFSYRQAHALEGIEQQLKDIKANCSIKP